MTVMCPIWWTCCAKIILSVFWIYQGIAYLTDAGIQVLSTRLNDVKGLRHLALEENDLQSPSLKALALALKSNLSLEDIELDECLISSDNIIKDTWRKLAHYLDLNWGGGRLLKEYSCLPGPLWPALLARASRPQKFNFAREVEQHYVSHFMHKYILKIKLIAQAIQHYIRRNSRYSA